MKNKTENKNGECSLLHEGPHVGSFLNYVNLIDCSLSTFNNQ